MTSAKILAMHSARQITAQQLLAQENTSLIHVIIRVGMQEAMMRRGKQSILKPQLHPMFSAFFTFESIEYFL